MFDAIDKTFSSFIVHKKKQMSYELPHISKSNRLFELGNLVIPEHFLMQGENSIYIVLEVLNNLSENPSLNEILETFVLFGMDGADNDNNDE